MCEALYGVHVGIHVCLYGNIGLLGYVCGFILSACSSQLEVAEGESQKPSPLQCLLSKSWKQVSTVYVPTLRCWDF